MPFRASSFFWLLAALALLLLAFGIRRYRARAAQSAKSGRRIPHRWSLTPRPTVNAEEARVWQWLITAFHDHHVMIKLPLTRFMRPSDKAEAEALYRLLRHVRCTFTICKPNGSVVGCVDVTGRRDISSKERRVKYSVLAQCSLAYRVLHADNLPHIADIRTDFLQESSSMQGPRKAKQEEKSMVEVQADLRSALNRRRQSRGDSDFGSLSLSDARPSDFNSHWAKDSFLHPLDSRSDDLR